MGKTKWTEERLEEEIRNVINKLNLDRMPTAREYKAHSVGGYDTISKLGGLRYFSKQIGLPVAKEVLVYKHICPVCGKEFESRCATAKYCSDECKSRVQKQCPICSTGFTGRSKYCSEGCKEIAKKMQARKKRNKYGVRPSGAFEKERRAREQGLHYADIQKAETLRLYGGIDQ